MKGSTKVLLSIAIFLFIKWTHFTFTVGDNGAVGIYVFVHIFVLTIWELYASAERDVEYKHPLKDLSSFKVKGMPWQCYSPLFVIVRGLDYLFRNDVK